VNYTAHFDKTQCNQCPNRDNCPVTDQKRKTILTVTETSFHRIKLIAQMGTEEYMEISSKRAGIEGIPSVLRRRYNIDQLPVRGLVRSKVWFGFKISAINCKRLIKRSGYDDKRHTFVIVLPEWCWKYLVFKDQLQHKCCRAIFLKAKKNSFLGDNHNIIL